jgi:RNA polymerase sigma-54 factor
MTNISQRLDLRQTQNLVMTPQLQQAIRLLQMNNVELSEYLEEELAQNPLLEKAEPDNGSGDNAEPAGPAAESDSVGEEFDSAWTGNEAETPEKPGPDFDPGAAAAGNGGKSSFDNPDFSLENTLSQETTLRDYLLEQLHVAFDDPRDRMIGALLIDQIDESGYLRVATDELAARLACTPERITHLLARMRQFDPAGIFARDLADCLRLQLEDRGQMDAPMAALLDNLPLLAAHDLGKLAQICGVNETYLADMIAEVKALNPRPASKFDHFVVQTVVPDVLMKKLPKDVGGGWRVELNSDTLPRVLVNQEYFTEVSKHAAAPKDKKYLDDQMQSANWLIRALDQRAKTILKVAGEIVEAQDAFFLYGVEFLVPLTLKDIAQKIDMHESTVSRVTSNKYIGTPRGIFELKYFFSTALVSADGSIHSAEAVRARIKTLIDAERPDGVLSDDAIVETLQKDGIEIARRTVAKYRESLNIPSSVQRRRQKRGTS